MALDQAKLHEVENGLRVNDGVTGGPIYTGGPTSPVGLDYPVDSFYIQNASTGSVIWRKYNTGVNDWVKAKASDFYQSVTADAETSTTSTTVYSTKLTLTTPDLPLGDYRVAWQNKWRASNANRAIDLRVQRNGVDVEAFVDFTPNVSRNSLVSGFKKLTGISGVQTITLQFKVNGTATTVFTSLAEIEFWRIA